MKNSLKMDQRAKSIKLLKENLGANLHNLGLADEFLNMT
jgi:hypothetical protein